MCPVDEFVAKNSFLEKLTREEVKNATIKKVVKQYFTTISYLSNNIISPSFKKIAHIGNYDIPDLEPLIELILFLAKNHFGFPSPKKKIFSNIFTFSV